MTGLRHAFRTKWSLGYAKFQWAATRKDRLKMVVSYLKEHNDMLDRIRPRGDTTLANPRSAAVSCKIMASSEDVVSDLEIGLAIPDENRVVLPAQFEQAIAMQRHQANIEANSEPAEVRSPLEIVQWEYKVSWSRRKAEGARLVGVYSTSCSPGDSNPVLLEWKNYVADNSKTKKLALSRVEKVAQLLSTETNLTKLHILQCVGYFQDTQHSRCGILYKMPPSTPETKIYTLRELLRSQNPRIKPALEHRYQLARTLANSMLQFHMASWLHKNYNSDNIIFFLPADLPVTADIRSPYIASFALSRPDHEVMESEIIPIAKTSLDFAYHHPDYHYPTTTTTTTTTSITSQNTYPTRLSPRFHRAYDVYSLGCVLLEIALWKPLDSFGWTEDHRSDLARWRKQLERATEKGLPFAAGLAYTSAVLRCLGSDAQGPSVPHPEQVRDFYWDVVRKLDGLGS
jgi:serine/threonine protein kinase